MSLRRIVSILVVAVAAISLAGCLPSTVESSRTKATEITVVLGASGGSLNPYSPLEANSQMGALIFRGLTTVTASGTPVPDLLSELPTSSNGGISADGKTVRLRLKPSVKWHDGRSVTASDVAYTIGVLRDGQLLDEPADSYSVIDAVAVVSPTELTVSLRHPDAPFVWRMVPYVLPEHLLGDAVPVASSHYWFKPVGCGPYRITEAVPGTSVTLAPIDKASAPLYVRFATTAEVARAAYDDSDAAVWIDGPKQAGTADESVSAVASNTWRALAFNVGRDAFAKDAVFRRVYLGLYSYEDTAAVPASDPFGLPLARREQLTPKQALKFMEGEGWTLTKGENKVLAKNGKRLEPTTAIRTIASEELPSFEARTARMGLAGIGFKTYSLDKLDIGGYLDRDYLTQGDSEWAVARTRIYLDQPYGIAWPFASQGKPSWANPFGPNVFGISDAELDRRYQALLAAGEPESAATAYKRLGQRLQELNLVSWERPEINYVLSKGVSGVNASPSLARALDGAATWRLSGQGGEK